MYNIHLILFLLQVILFFSFAEMSHWAPMFSLYIDKFCVREIVHDYKFMLNN